MNHFILISLAVLAVSCHGSDLSHGATLLGGINTLGSLSLGLGYGYSGLASGLGYGHGLGYGSGIAYSGYGSGLGYSGYGGHKTIIAATPAVVTTQVLSSPSLGYGYGYGNGLKYGSGLGYSSGYTNYNGHGVTVKGPSTVPAVISGPSGKIVANGLYGVPNHGYGYSGLASGLGYGHDLGYGSGIAYSGYRSGLDYSGYGGHKTIIAATPAVVTTQVLSSPSLSYSYGYGNGLKYGSGIGYSSGYTSYNGHGVTVKGPSTVPAVISGPSGKIVANGLYGVPNHGW